ncbi:WD40 repeat [Trinorchestia longiramus]|nr:WD40 repeat [Trinorchestia longiramus]
MSHLNLGSQLSSVLKLDSGDGPLGPVPRWQRKAQDQGITRLPSNNDNSLCNRSAGLSITPRNKSSTPTSFLLDASLGSTSAGSSKSPGRGVVAGKRGKSPSRTLKLSLRQKTPTRSTPTTPNRHFDSSYAGDRFIPVRPTELELERSQHLMMEQMRKDEGVVRDDDEGLTQQEREHRERMAENLNDGQPIDHRIVHFSTRAPQSNNPVKNHKVLYSATKASANKTGISRHIPREPERVLDAPEFKDDYYLHLVDWSRNNHVVVALGGCVYVWNAGDGSISFLTQVESPEYISSLSWIADGSVLGVGLSDGDIQLWDVSQENLIRTMTGHEARVATLAWSSTLLTSGARSGQIIHHDVRIPHHATVVINAHNQEVCGMSWNNDGRMLASGGNDNVVNIWDGRSPTALHRLSSHQAAVKAVAWCPWQSNVLGTGGGTADRTIRIWNANAGTCIKELLTSSQVSSMVWNDSYKELITGHGFSDNQLTMWKYPSFTKVADLTGHTGRVLKLVSSPDGQMVASAAADETIRLWKCWPAQAKDKKHARALAPVSSIAKSIR